MIARLLAALALLWTNLAFAQPATPATPSAVPVANAPMLAPARQFVEGVDYTRLPRAVPVSTGAQIEVVEVFSYGCIHCAGIEPHMKRWKASQPANAKLVLIPAAFNAQWEVSARAYYAAEALGVLDRTHQATFDARFVQNKNLATAEDYADLYATLGVDRAKFLATFKSFGINTKIKRSNQLAMQYLVDATPALLVDGKFKLEPRSLADAPDLINFVVQKAAAERGAQ